MEKNFSKFIYLSPEETEPTIVSRAVNQTLQLQELTGGDLFDILRPDDYGIEGTIAKYNIFVNDEMLSGAFLPNVVLNAEALMVKEYNKAGLIFGPLVVAGIDDNGYTIGVDDNDIDEIIRILKSHLLQNVKR